MPPAKKPTKLLKVGISSRVSPALKKQLERAAKAEKRTLSQYIEIVLTQHLTAPPPRAARDGGSSE